jgi:hypothetical protein
MITDRINVRNRDRHDEIHRSLAIIVLQSGREFFCLNG